MTASSERDPLLPKASVSAFSAIAKRFRGLTSKKDGLDFNSPTQTLVPPLGPMDISASARHNILAGIWLSQFLSALNMTLVPTMLPQISSEFKKFNQASWVGTAYLLATCTFTPLYGRLCSVMGRRGANQSAVIFACMGILTCGSSNSMLMLIIARFISGMGGGGIFTIASIITSDMYGMRTRSFMQSIGGIFYGLGMGLGGPIGGFITDWLGWRWAFFLQIPFFAMSFILTMRSLTYVTPGSGRSTSDILKRIDYAGSFSLLGMTGSILFFMSMKYNEGYEWTEPCVWVSLLCVVLFVPLFIFIELYIAVEPVLPISFLTQKVPLLIGCSNAWVSVCNLSVTYYYPTWFQTVMLSSASTAGLHMLPNSVCISGGSFFAGWMMKRNGSYKTLNMVFGILPFFAAVLMTQMKETSHPAHLWLSITPLGFGNAVVLQTLFIALVSHLPESEMPIGAGFVQLLRGLGQIVGLAGASAIFQTRLTSELHARLPSGSEELIEKIRHSSSLVASLPPHIQQVSKDSYAASLKSVFTLAAAATFMAFILRIPIPDKQLEDAAPKSQVGSEDDDGIHSDDSSLVEEIHNDEENVVKPGQQATTT